MLLERLIAKVMQKVMDFAEKVTGKADDAVKETSKDMNDQIHPRLKEIDSGRKIKGRDSGVIRRSFLE